MAYAYEQKKKIVETVAKLVAEGLSLWGACKKIPITYDTFVKWINEKYEENEDSNELKNIYDSALQTQTQYLNDLAEDGLAYLLRPHIEQTLHYEHTPITDANGSFQKDENGEVKTIKVLAKTVQYHKAPQFNAIQLRLIKRHADYKENANQTPINATDPETMDWSREGEDGTRKVQ